LTYHDPEFNPPYNNLRAMPVIRGGSDTSGWLRAFDQAQGFPFQNSGDRTRFKGLNESNRPRRQ
jgi:hypothetical protein